MNGCASLEKSMHLQLDLLALSSILPGQDLRFKTTFWSVRPSVSPIFDERSQKASLGRKNSQASVREMTSVELFLYMKGMNALMELNPGSK